jgi:hypothetical protein
MVLSTSCVVDAMNDILHLSIKAKINKVTLCAPRWPAKNTPCIGVQTDVQVDEAPFLKSLQCLSEALYNHLTADRGFARSTARRDRRG